MKAAQKKVPQIYLDFEQDVQLITVTIVVGEVRKPLKF